MWRKLVQGSLADFHALFITDLYLQLAAKPGSLESLQQLIEIIRNPVSSAAALSGVTVGKEDKARQSRDKKVSWTYCLPLMVLEYFSDQKILTSFFFLSFSS